MTPAERAAWERLCDAAQRRGLRPPTPEALERVRPLLTCPAPLGWIVRRPRLLGWVTHLRQLDGEKPAERYREELRRRTHRLTTGDEDAFDRTIRLYRQREMLRITLRDLTRRAPLRTVTREISDLADALVEATLSFHDRILPERYGPAHGNGFCVIAMGKHGGRELNYSSDIDVLFLSEEGPGRRERALVLARRIIGSLSTVTGDGFAFRVDANLRPYGRDGVLVNTPDELEEYYESSGQTWERAALLKARPCAGGVALGEGLIARLRPFVYPRSLDLRAVEALAQMKQRIDRQRDNGPDDVKLGHGGIREIEFFVQALQLLHGGRQPRLRVRATLEALDALLYAGLVSVDDRDALAEAYGFLRDVEHRLQVPEDQQTHRLPARGSEAHSALSRRMGLSDPEAFAARLERHRAAVHARFSKLLETAEERPRHTRDVDAALCWSDESIDRIAALARLGFGETDGAVALIDRMKRLSDGPFGARGRERHPLLAERLLDEMSRSPAPDAALTRFSQLMPPRWEPGALATILDANAATTRLLVLLFATSESLTGDFQRHPELLDTLVRSGDALLEKDAAALRAELAERLDGAVDIEARLAILRRVRREETLRIGLHDLAGRIDVLQVGRQLTGLAEVLCGVAFELARTEVSQRFGEPSSPRIAVLGFGSFGGEELGYESDLDLVFVHEAAGQTSGGTRAPIDGHEWAARIVQRFLAFLTLTSGEGVLYRVDARLRPSGSAGPLVVSRATFASYHHLDGERVRSAALWERQALLRARAVAGDVSLGQELTRDVLDASVREPVPPDAAAQIHDMRRRLDRVVPGAVDPKKGPGGLLDVEFAAQYLELAHGLRIPSTPLAIDRLAEVGGLSRDDADELRRAWHQLRRIESRLRLTYGRPDVYVPLSGPALSALARHLGDAAPDGPVRLLAHLERLMGDTRRLFERLVPAA